MRAMYYFIKLTIYISYICIEVLKIYSFENLLSYENISTTLKLSDYSRHF